MPQHTDECCRFDAVLLSHSAAAVKALDRFRFLAFAHRGEDNAHSLDRQSPPRKFYLSCTKDFTLDIFIFTCQG
jgi:hypothetical protein